MSIFWSLFLLCAYSAAFLVAAYAEPLTWPAAMIGGLLGGIAAGWSWTAQGLYFSRVTVCATEAPLAEHDKSDVHGASDIADSKQSDIPLENSVVVPNEDSKPSSSRTKRMKTNSWDEAKASSYLGGLFSSLYVGLEVVAKLLSAGLLIAAGVGPTFAIFTISAVLASFATLFLPTPPLANKELANQVTGGRALPGIARIRDQAQATIRLFLMSPVIRSIDSFYVLFGTTFAFGDLYLNGQIVSESLGVSAVGWLAAIVPIVATATSFPLAYTGTTTKRKNIGMHIGNLTFLTVGILAFSASATQLKDLGWGIAFVYVLLGIGRGVFETTGKSVIVDFFPGDAATPAYANLHTSSGLAFAIAFVIFEYIPQVAIGVIIFLVAVLSIVLTQIAFNAFDSTQKSKTLDVEDGKLRDQKRIVNMQYAKELEADDGSEIGQSVAEVANA